MAAELMLIGVAKVALEEGVKFLYAQAGEVLNAWRERRKNPAAPAPLVISPPAQVTVGIPHPSSAMPNPETVLTLQDLRLEAERIASGEISIDEPAARASVAALREVIEAALGASITFAGEAARSIKVADVNVVVKDVEGRLAGVRLDAGQGGEVKGVRVQAENVKAGADVVGVQVGRGPDPNANARIPPSRPIKILFLAANPTDTEPLRLDEEIRSIDGALRESQYRDQFEIDQHWAVRVGDLQGALLRFRPDIVHFSGHGTPSSEIVLESGSGAAQSVSREALSDLFSALGGNIRCVVLNACYSEEQARAIAEHIDCVVGMTKAVGDAAAIQFATGFYRAIGYGSDIQTAFDLGKNLIDLQNLADKDIPQLVFAKANPKDVVFAASD